MAFNAYADIAVLVAAAWRAELVRLRNMRQVRRLVVVWK